MVSRNSFADAIAEMTRYKRMRIKRFTSAEIWVCRARHDAILSDQIDKQEE
jgi:hypothetical protein